MKYFATIIMIFLVTTVSLSPTKKHSFLPLNEFDYNSYLYSRGYLYTTNPKVVPKQYVKVYPNLWIDKKSYFTISTDRKVIVIGFAVDVRDSNIKTESLANNLAAILSSSEKLFHKECDYICGRYVILYTSSDETLSIVTDASGLRKAYFSEDGTTASSHAKLVNDNLCGGKTPAKLLPPWPWPVVFNSLKTPYPNVLLLPPNHKLALASSKITRIFPRENFTPIETQSGIEQFKKYASEALLGASKQYRSPLLFCFTSGLDSRLSIALAYDKGIDLNAFTYECTKTDTKTDMQYAELFCKKWHIPHYKAYDKAGHLTSTKLKDLLDQNNYQRFGHFKYPLTESIITTLGIDNFLVINSNILEIGRTWFKFNKYKVGKNKHPANTLYAKLTGINLEKYIGYDIRKLYFWEQQLGSFLLLHLMQYDISSDVFNPYNCRAIIDIMLRTSWNWGDIQSSIINDWLNKLDKRVDFPQYNSHYEIFNKS